MWNGNFNIDNPAQNKGKELFQLVLGSSNLSNGPSLPTLNKAATVSPCWLLHTCSLHSANYQFLSALCASPQPSSSLIPPEKRDSPSHLCCSPSPFIVPASRFSPHPRVCFSRPSLSRLFFLPLFISPAVMLFKLTCQENRLSAQRQFSNERGKAGGEQEGCSSPVGEF